MEEASIETMTPEQKAKDLFLRYYELLPNYVYSRDGATYEAKRFALIAVEEITDILLKLSNLRELSYYEEVKQEIEKL